MTDRIDNVLHNGEYVRLMEMIKEKEADRIFCRHGLAHCLDVARIGCILCMDEGVNVDRELLYAAALLHDIGRADPMGSGVQHNRQSVELAEGILRASGFDGNETAEVCGAIAAHSTGGKESMDGKNGENSENSKNLAYILYKADKLSRNCFDCKAAGECYWPDEIRNKRIVY